EELPALPIKEPIEGIEKIHTLKAIPKEQRRLPGQYVRDRNHYKEWMAAQRIAQRIFSELDARYGKLTVRYWEKSHKDPARDFHEFVLQEARDLVEDIPETKESVTQWLQMEKSKKVVKLTLSPIQLDANILYLIRCRRRFKVEERDWVIKNMPF
ncbi:MAG: hypothetical protein AABX02_05175, partial [archaeon]